MFKASSTSAWALKALSWWEVVSLWVSEWVRFFHWRAAFCGVTHLGHPR